MAFLLILICISYCTSAQPRTTSSTTTTSSAGVCCLCQGDNFGNQGCRQDQECENEICPFDSYCCNRNWDEICVDVATARCELRSRPICCGCTVGQGGQPGCQTDPECEDIICPNDAFCCGGDDDGQGFWDLLCVNQAYDVCKSFID